MKNLSRIISTIFVVLLSSNIHSMQNNVNLKSNSSTTNKIHNNNTLFEFEQKFNGKISFEEIYNY